VTSAADDRPHLDGVTLLDGMPDAAIVADLAGVIVHVNRAACVLLGAAPADLLGAPLVRIIPDRLRSAHQAGFERFAKSRTGPLVGGRGVRLPALRGDGTEVEVELALSLHTTTGGDDLLLGILRDLGDRVELERQRRITTYLRTSRDVMTQLAVGADAVSLEEAAPVMLEALGHGLGWDGGAVWIHDAGELRPLATWPDAVDSVGRVMTDGVTMKRGQGLPGTVAASRSGLWLETVSTETVFLRQAQADRAGVRSCFAFPVFVASQVAGVVEMYSRAEHAPEPELLAVLETAGLEIGRYLERAQTRRHLVEMAEALQASLLPPLSPDVPGLDVAVRYRAAGGEGLVGGDFFDVFPLPDGAWAILIGDVSGRGPRAAALTALARYTVRAAAIGAGSPMAVLGVLNDVVRRELDTSYGGDERFLTVAYLTIAPSPKGFDIQVACGGHPYPLARGADGVVTEVRCDGDLIGAFAVHECRDEAVVLAAGDVLVLVTDGVTEARGSGDEFGEERLREVIASAAGGAAELADAIETAVLSHLEGHPQDDLAIVVLRHPPRTEVTTTIDVHVAASDAAV
jgi:PAS domain S-box-containing protein